MIEERRPAEEVIAAIERRGEKIPDDVRRLIYRALPGESSEESAGLFGMFG